MVYMINVEGERVMKAYAMINIKHKKQRKSIGMYHVLRRNHKAEAKTITLITLPFDSSRCGASYKPILREFGVWREKRLCKHRNYNKSRPTFQSVRRALDPLLPNHNNQFAVNSKKTPSPTLINLFRHELQTRLPRVQSILSSKESILSFGRLKCKEKD